MYPERIHCLVEMNPAVHFVFRGFVVSRFVVWVHFGFQPLKGCSVRNTGSFFRDFSLASTPTRKNGRFSQPSNYCAAPKNLTIGIDASQLDRGDILSSEKTELCNAVFREKNAFKHGKGPYSGHEYGFAMEDSASRVGLPNVVSSTDKSETRVVNKAHSTRTPLSGEMTSPHGPRILPVRCFEPLLGS